MQAMKTVGVGLIVLMTTSAASMAGEWQHSGKGGNSDFQYFNKQCHAFYAPAEAKLGLMAIGLVAGMISLPDMSGIALAGRAYRTCMAQHGWTENGVKFVPIPLDGSLRTANIMGQTVELKNSSPQQTQKKRAEGDSKVNGAKPPCVKSLFAVPNRCP